MRPTPDSRSTGYLDLSPPLKWAGGKRWLVPRLHGVWKHHDHRRLVEPFVGGLAIALGLAPQAALLNDLNCHLINFYQWLQRGLVIETQMANDRRIYYHYRDRFNHLVRSGQHATQEAAELFYYLNRTGYNGLCRFNKKGEFNVPMGRYRAINYVFDFRDYLPALGPWRFTCQDFESLDTGPGDFVYADPPYDVEFTSYSAGGFDWEAQQRLARWLGSHPGPVVASNQATDRILHLYRDLGFQIELLEAPRRISSSGDRTPALEMLATRGI